MTHQTKIGFLSLVLVSALFAFPSFAIDNDPGFCSRWLSKTKQTWQEVAKPAIAKYGIEVKESKGARLLFAPTETNPIDKPALGFYTPVDEYYAGENKVWSALLKTWQFIPSRVLGLIRGSQGHWRGCVKGDPDYVLSFAAGVNNCLINIPVYKAAQIPKLRQALNLKRQFVGSLVLTVAALFPVSYYVVTPMLDAGNIAYIEDAADQAVQRHFEYYLNALQYDIRYKTTREFAREALNANREENIEVMRQALAQVQQMDVSNRSFLTDFDFKNFQGTPEQVADLVKYPQFGHLAKFQQKDVESLELYMPRWKTIVQIHWYMHQMMSLTPESLAAPEALNQKAAQLPGFKTQIDSFKSSDFYQSVQAHFKGGQLTLNQSQGLIKTWLYYRIRLHEAELLGLKIKDFSMQDYEQELLADALANPELWNLPGDAKLWQKSVLFPDRR